MDTKHLFSLYFGTLDPAQKTQNAKNVQHMFSPNTKVTNPGVQGRYEPCKPTPTALDPHEHYLLAETAGLIPKPRTVLNLKLEPKVQDGSG